MIMKKGDINMINLTVYQRGNGDAKDEYDDDDDDDDEHDDEYDNDNGDDDDVHREEGNSNSLPPGDGD